MSNKNIQEDTELAHLSIISPNKTVVFYSPVEGKDILVRTGTIQNGSCFIHSVLHAYSKDYVVMNESGREKFVKKLRMSLARKIDKEHWENMSNGLIAKVPFQENVNKILTDFYTFITRGTVGKTKSVRNVIRKLIVADKDTETYKLITEMIPLGSFEQNILPSSYEKCNENKISDCKKCISTFAVTYYKTIFDKIKGEISQENIDFYLNKMKLLVLAIVNEAEDLSYIEYIESLYDSSIDIDTYNIGLISDKFNRDIYFIDSKTRLPYRAYDTTIKNERDVANEKDEKDDITIKKRKSIILMWTGGCHYEIVGRLLPGNRIQREFEHKDPLIQRIYTFICKPERIPDMYPNLISFLPKNIRQKLDIDISDDEIEHERSRSRSRSRSHKREGNDASTIKIPKKIESSSDDSSSAYEKSDSDEETNEK